MNKSLDGMPPIAAVDLFCGVGGLTHGLLQAKIPVFAGVDVDPECHYPYERNNRCMFVREDISKLSGFEVASFYPTGHIKVLVGCAPCQPFSTYNQGKKNRRPNKWELLSAFGRIIQEASPEIVSMENVPRLAKEAVFRQFVTDMRRLGYAVSYSNVNCWLYGVPQSRKRLVLFASKFGPVELIGPTHTRNRHRTVRQAIGRLEAITAGEISKKDTLHRASAL